MASVAFFPFAFETLLELLYSHLSQPFSRTITQPLIWRPRTVLLAAANITGRDTQYEYN